MSVVQIPNLPAAIALNGDEPVEIVQSGQSRRVGVQAIANLGVVVTTSQVIESITVLQGIPVQTTSPIYVEGYYAKGDGGDGYFYGVSGAAPGTYVNNGGTIIVPINGNGSSAWIRFVSGPISAKAFGAKTNTPSFDNGPALRAWATCGYSALYLPAGDYYVSSYVSLNVNYYQYGDVSLTAGIILPYKSYVYTDGDSTRLVFKNLTNTICGIAIDIPVPSSSGGPYPISSGGPTIQRLTICTDSSNSSDPNGAYGVVTPSYPLLFSYKRPQYFLDVNFTNAANNQYTLAVSWRVGMLIGDVVGGSYRVTGLGSYDATISDVGQKDCISFKAKSFNAYQLNILIDVSHWRTCVEISNGVEGFSLTGECFACWYGVNFTSTSPSSLPGGYIDNFHTNANYRGLNIVNRQYLSIGNLEVYRSGTYFNHGSLWAAIEIGTNSQAMISNLTIIGSPTFSNCIGIYGTSNTSCYSVSQWDANSINTMCKLVGTTDAYLGFGRVFSKINYIFDLESSANDIFAAGLTFRTAQVPDNYFIADGTINKDRLYFPAVTSIPGQQVSVLSATAAGSYTVRPRLTPNVLQVNLGPGSGGAFDYNIFLNVDDSVGGDKVSIKFIMSTSSNPTVSVYSGTVADPGSLLTKFNNSTGSLTGKRYNAQYVFYAYLNVWSEYSVTESLETSF